MKRTTRATFAALSAVGAIVGAGAALSGTAWVNAGTQGDPEPKVQSTQNASTTLTALQAEEARLRHLLSSVTPQPQPQPTYASTGASGAGGAVESEYEDEGEEYEDEGEEDEDEDEAEYEGLDD